jgi:flagellar hook assembly protein FlgD
MKLSVPETFSLTQNYPNPFNPETHIDYNLANAQEQLTRLVIYNTLGEEIRMLVDEKQSAGAYRATWDGRNDAGRRVASGVYFYKLHSGSFAQLKKMMLIK